MRILGIDPGSRFMGVACVDEERGELRYLDHRVFALKSSRFSARLWELQKSLLDYMKEYRPEHVVVEKIFFGKNADSAFKLGHVRGVCLLSAEMMEAELFEYAARSVKKSVTGKGDASKESVEYIVNQIFGIQNNGKWDGTDALALTVCHAREWAVKSLLKREGVNL